MRLLAVAAAAALSVSVSVPVSVAQAHRLDELLTASMISLNRDHIEISLHIVPGQALASRVLSKLDTNGDKTLDASEREVFASQLASRINLSIDDRQTDLKLVSATFPPLQAIRDGSGAMTLDLSTPNQIFSKGLHRLKLSVKPKEEGDVYLVNALVPKDRSLQILSQHRSYDQSSYELEFSYSESPLQLNNSTGDVTNFQSFFALGMRHIAQGTDHLLFLLTLLLTAPLMAVGSAWVRRPSVKESFFKIGEIVTAFTIGHSVTLALSALGVVTFPSQPIEILIAISILVSALQTLRPLFPGRESWIAGFFGLVHGLAFGETLSKLGLAQGDRIVSLLGFNLGIEAMQLVVVVGAMPPLLYFSRSPRYSVIRIVGGLIASGAALVWIYERV